MKLLNITNRYYIAIALGLLMVSSAFLAYRVLYVIDQDMSDHLLFEKQEIEQQLAGQPQLQGMPFVFGDRIVIEPIEKFSSFRVNVHDAMEFDIYRKHIVPFRFLVYEQQIGDGAYRITIRKRLTENKELANGVVLTLLLVAIDIIACFYFLNRWISSHIWFPFYRALSSLKQFDLQKGGSVLFKRSVVEEFNTLNAELTKLTDKVTNDYRNLREFTENMSHETQTPLAIIRSKLELLLQADNLTQVQIEHVRSTLDSVNRLSKMNKGLIMLTRIDNDQYADETELPLGPIIQKQLVALESFITSRELVVVQNIAESVTIRMSPHLAEILITNLLSNAIKYNVNGGQLIVELNSNQMMIANSGDPLSIPNEQIFERFKKGNQPDSIGLGLAIVKRICQHHDCSIGYVYEDRLHKFIVGFPQETES